MPRLLCIALCCLVLAGCVPTSAVRMPGSMEKEVNGPSGLIFGSIGEASPSAFTSQSIFFRKKGSTDSGQITFIHDGLWNVPIDFDDKAVRGTLFAVRLPVGEYELHQVMFFINRGQFGTTTFKAKEEFSIPFRVEEGRSIYLGEFVAVPVMGKNFFGMAVPAGGYFVVSNKFDRDLSLLTMKSEAVAGWQAQNATIDPKSINSPAFRN